MKTISSARHKSRGQSMLEFSLLAPVFVLLMVGVLDFGRAGFYFVAGSNLARTGARDAAVYNLGSGYTDANVLSAVQTQANAETISISQPALCGTATPPQPPAALSACQTPAVGKAYLFIDRSNAGVSNNPPYVLVSVVYAYRPMTPMLSDLTGTIYIVSTSAMDTEWLP